jgi:coenzyme F420-dependent glucose-6-phosphate dehydrogenase
MVNIGYAISSEEHAPNDIVEHASRAEEIGFPYALISDHFHPWVPKQGHAPFVWGVIGAIAHATRTLRLGTGVTCPMIRIHPAIIAQAAATAACQMPGRFFLGVGTGERLNEHVLGDHWPSHEVRTEMLAEAVEVIRHLWQGGTRSYRGDYYEVENARIYTLPDELPPIAIAAAGPEAAELAGRIGDAFVGTAPEAKNVQAFEKAGGKGKPIYGKVTVCYHESEAEAKKIAHEWWPNGGLKGALSVEVALPEHYEEAVKILTPDDVAKHVVCGPDAQKHVERIDEYVEAGYDHVYVHQVGPDQESFFRFYEKEILPRYRDGKARSGHAA